ncbi:MAG TPA: iron-sulfur cluster biosynthesis family protein, partial [Longimicrobiales bacterium]|nr:iron-sulfur cluster biosynthesis family protein [Longimicrobiales bacterium]
MITFTDEAREVILSLVDQVEDSCLRLAVVGGSPLAPDFDFSLVETASRAEGDEILDAGGFRVLVDADSIARVSGLTVDWVERNGLTGFELRPAPPPPGQRP